MQFVIDEALSQRFPGLNVVPVKVEGVKIRKESSELEQRKEKAYDEVRQRFTLESVKNDPTIRAYRDFYWRVGIDPTKVRPAGEALVRRILAGKPVPSINTLVDSYNMVSARTGVAIGAWDFDQLNGDLRMRPSSPGEKFWGIGMTQEAKLSGKEIVIQDKEKLIAIYPYRDAERAKITLDTRDVLFFMCGVPGLNRKELESGAEETSKAVVAFNGGTVVSF